MPVLSPSGMFQVPFRELWTSQFSEWEKSCLDVRVFFIQLDVCFPFSFLVFFTTLKISIKKIFHLKSEPQFHTCNFVTVQLWREKLRGAEVIDLSIKSHCHVYTSWSNHNSFGNVFGDLESKH